MWGGKNSKVYHENIRRPLTLILGAGGRGWKKSGINYVCEAEISVAM
jgi:hypothetical protein